MILFGASRDMARIPSVTQIIADVVGRKLFSGQALA
jgi:hypothetical protein